MDTRKRVAKQYLIINEKNIRVNYGTTDKKNPHVIYARAKGTVKPFVDKKTYSPDIKELKKTFISIVKKKVKKLKSLETDKLLCNIDISENGLIFGKSGHMRYEVFIKPVEMKPLEDYETDIRKLAVEINNEIKTFLETRGINTF